MTELQIANLLKSVLLNIGVVVVGFGLAVVGTLIDSLLGMPRLSSRYAIAIGCLFLVTGFLIRVWASFEFYEHQAKVISLEPQLTLLTTGPYHFSRNPLHLGGNVFVFFGAALLLGSPFALAITAAHLPGVNLFIRQKERQLEVHFGEAWERYRSRVRRWI